MSKNITYLVYTILLTVFITTFSGCSSKNTSFYSYNNDKSFPNKEEFDYKVNNDISYSILYDNLNIQYKNWKGVKYKYGGSSKNGIDCSAFVQKTFKDRFNIRIPRTTAMQSKIGKKISINELEMGDLIFFKTGYNSRHVGIYLEGGKFMHASTKRGVTISRLDNNYYKNHFWKIKRVIN